MAEDNIIKELENLPEELDAITKHPVIKPLLDFREAVKSLLRDNSLEREYLEKKRNRLIELIGTGIYEDSRIAQRYAEVLEVYERLFLIFTKYAEVADETVKKIKKTVDTNYLTWEEHRKILTESRPTQKPILTKESIEKEINAFDEVVDSKPQSRNPWILHIKEVSRLHPNLKSSELTRLARQTYNPNG